jgi:outer membrane protein OmpA-like peptidoglycan-associated protein
MRLLALPVLLSLFVSSTAFAQGAGVSAGGTVSGSTQTGVSAGGAATGAAPAAPALPAAPAAPAAAAPAAPAAAAPAAPAAPVSGSAATTAPATTGGALGAQQLAQTENPQSIDAQNAANAREWEERDSKLSESPTLTGGAGLLRTQHAQGGAAGQFRVSFSTEYFSAGFLCTTDFPCRAPNHVGTVTTDGLDHIGGHLSLSANVLNWLEIYLGTSAVANSDNQNRPSLLQVLGDSNIGAKAYGLVAGKVLYVGGAMELWLLNGTGAVGLDGSGTSMKFRGLATADLRGTESKVPVRISLNTTYSLDNSGDVLTQTELARKEPVTRIERFGLGVNRVDHFDIALGAEFFVAKEKVRPFVEYVVQIPINRQGYQCVPTNPSHDHCLANDQLAPSTVSLGARFLPWKPGFSLLAALDLGVTGQNDFIEEMSPTPPWMLHIGAGWAFDTADRPPVIQMKTVEKVVDRTPPPRAKIVGLVHEEGKPATVPVPVPNAIVTWDSAPGHTAMYTGADGRFVTEEVDAGNYTFGVRADGYKPGTCGVQIAPGTKGEVNADCSLVALPKVGIVKGNAKDEGGSGVSGATVYVHDATGKDVSLAADQAGFFKFDTVQPGTARLSVDADGYLAAVANVDVVAGKEVQQDITLVKKPKKSLVTVGAKEITIKQQIQFAVNSAQILPESNALLAEIADAILRTPRIKKLEIQGHTDSTGTPDKNQQLSEDRAEAVRAWLVAHGVTPERLVAHGYGQTKPLYPNVTTFNRTRNRRVQFVILEQE